MTKQEFLEAKERANKYADLEYELNKLDDVLKNIKVYNNLTLTTTTSVTNTNIRINSQIRNGLVSVIQDYRDSIVEQMAEI